MFGTLLCDPRGFMFKRLLNSIPMFIAINLYLAIFFEVMYECTCLAFSVVFLFTKACVYLCARDIVCMKRVKTDRARRSTHML